MSKHIKATVILLIVAALLVILVFWMQAKQNDKNNFTRQIPPTIVEAATARQEQWQQQIQATGTLEATQGVQLQSAVTGGGVITGIFFRSGQYVKAGQVLFQINPGQDRTLITAPFDGRVGLKQVDLGSFVRQGDNLVTIQDTDPMKVVFSIPQVYMANLGIGQEVQVAADAFPNQVFVGKVYAINSQLDPNTRSLQMWASLANHDQKLVPGTFVEVTLLAGETVPVITVPQTAIVYADQSNYVYKIVNGKAQQTNVTLGMRKGNEVEVKGLQVGDLIATSGQNKFSDGWPLIVYGSPQYQAMMKKLTAPGAKNDKAGKASPSATSKNTDSNSLLSSATANSSANN